MSGDTRKVVGWVLLGLLAFFILINLEDVRINFFWVVKVHMPVALALFIAAGMGAASVFALQFYKKFRRDDKGQP
jgi:uncharacterized integral membrane protein